MATGNALLTDLYELNMAASFLRRGMTGAATFSLFVRSLPPTRGFLVAAGLEDCLDYLEAFRFDDVALNYLSTVGFDKRALGDFAGLRFTGDVWAAPEGRILFANEPLLEISAPLPEAQLIETLLLNQVTFQTALASKAARCVIAAAGRIDLVEFGFRRTHGIDAGMAAARTALLVGFTSTSNVEAARRFDLVPAGTMAHSYIEAFPTEVDAFRSFAQDLPGRTTFLVDTYDTLRGVRNAIAVIRELGLGGRSAIRIDSGDLAGLAKEARAIFDEAGLPDVRIFVSGGLDEHDLQQLIVGGAPVDAAGIGTRLGVSADAPYLDSVYKLVEVDGRPVAKLSAAKETLPGAKQIFRAQGLHDRLGLRHETPPAGTSPILTPVMIAGRRLAPRPPLAEARARFDADLAQLPAAAARLDGPQAPTVELTAALAGLAARVRDELRGA